MRSCYLIFASILSYSTLCYAKEVKFLPQVQDKQTIVHQTQCTRNVESTKQTSDYKSVYHIKIPSQVLNRTTPLSLKSLFLSIEDMKFTVNYPKLKYPKPSYTFYALTRLSLTVEIVGGKNDSLFKQSYVWDNNETQYLIDAKKEKETQAIYMGSPECDSSPTNKYRRCSFDQEVNTLESPHFLSKTLRSYSLLYPNAPLTVYVSYTSRIEAECTRPKTTAQITTTAFPPSLYFRSNSSR